MSCNDCDRLASLVADLRALADEYDRGDDAEQLLAMQIRKRLDRHAPEEGR